MDGGIRSGQDVLKALALGATGTLIGRAFLYGLGAMGEAGVTQGAGDHPQGARPDDGVLRPHRHPHRRPARPAAGNVLRTSRAAHRHEAGRSSRRPEGLASAPLARAAGRKARLGPACSRSGSPAGSAVPSAFLIHAGWAAAACVALLLPARRLRRAAPPPAPRRHRCAATGRARARARASLAARGRAPSKVLQRSTLPLSTPRLNQLTRCALVPCVKLSGTTVPCDLRCSVSSPICAAALSAFSMSPGSRRQPLLLLRARWPRRRRSSRPAARRARSARSPAPRRRGRAARRPCRMMPSRFCTWWPTSWAIT